MTPEEPKLEPIEPSEPTTSSEPNERLEPPSEPLPTGDRLVEPTKQDPKLLFVSLMSDPKASDESRLEAAEQISDQINSLADGPNSQDPSKKQLLDQIIISFMDYFDSTEPQFISDTPCQKLRKWILDVIHRLPAVDALRVHVPRLIKIMFNLFEIDNEENVGTVLRIIVELHKAYKPEFMTEIVTFMDKVKNLYSDIRNVFDLNSMFEDKRLVVKDLGDKSVKEFLSKIHTIKTIEVEIPPSNVLTQGSSQPNQEQGSSTPSSDSTLSAPSQNTATQKTTQTYTLIPKANRSIRVMSELPIIVVLLYQMYKVELQQPLEQLLPLVLETTVLRPTEEVRKSIRTSEKMDKEIYVEFISAQIKCLSFVAYLLRMYTTTVAKHHVKLSQGLLGLIHDTPHEVVSVRKELIAASKYIFQSELRDKFIDHLHILCNDDILVGTGWTVYETLRPQAYQILVDLLTNYKGRIRLNDLTAAINLFAKNLHDNTLLPQFQLMSCKAFNNLVSYSMVALSDENIEPKEKASIRDLLMRMIEIYVLKFKNIAVFQLPNLKKRLRAHFHQTNPIDPIVHTQSQQSSQSDKENHNETTPNERPRLDFPSSSSSTIQFYNIVECKSLIRSLIIGVKTAIEAIPNPRLQNNVEPLLIPEDAKIFHPKETIALIRLLKYGLKTLDVFTLTSPSLPMSHMTQMNRVAQQNRNKEEKELMESFASVFTKLHPLIFHEIFSKMIHFVVVRTRQNNGILNVVNFIISAPSVSPIFSTILSEYLIERMEQIGSSEELSVLYLRMFRMVFASVTLYPADNEQMLKPLLHSIVNKSVELALSAKDPYTYFLLLRALFRSIGGGSHDQLYAEFLPLLPNLLQGLNSFQSGQHRQYMKDLFTELCLTVPVRLSSLMPFMPTLIYPLVSALNGPNQLVSQGLRTLELCVDNLTPDYLYDLLLPVRAELMQSLWKTVRHPVDVIAQNCLRVLGKFGGNNRRMLVEPQKLTYIEQKEGSNSHGITIVVHFPDQKASINLPIDKAISIACEHLKNNQGNYFYKHHSWETIKGFIEASIGNPVDQGQKIKNFFSNPNLATAHIPIRKENIYKCQDQIARNVYKMSLVSMMMAASTPNLKNSVIPFLNAVVRHHVMLSIGLHLHPQSSEQSQSGMDPYALVDALAEVIGHDDKDICKSGYYVMVLMVESVTMLLGTRERACELPLINYLVKQMIDLCYSGAWYSKMGGCIAIRYFTDNMPSGWLFKSVSRFVRALLRIMNDLTGELSSGVVDMAQSNLERLLNVCAKPIEPTNSEESILAQAQTKAMHDVINELLKDIIHQNLSVRIQAMKSIELLAKLSNMSVIKMIEPHHEILRSMLPFLSPHHDSEKNSVHLLDRQPVRAQIGTIHGATFCTNLEPRVFVIDPNLPDHKVYLDQLIRICENDDQTLKKLHCYANVTSLAPVRTAAIQALASLHYLKDYEQKIFTILLQSTESSIPEIQDEAHSCLVKFVGKVELDPAFIQKEVSPMLGRLKESSMWDMLSVKRLICFAKLFPKIFPETYCNELQDHISNITKSATNDLKVPLEPNEKVYTRTRSANEKIKICAGIIELMVLVPNVTQTNIRELVALIFKVESALIMESGSQLRIPLKKFLMRIPEYTMQLLMTERNLNEQQVYRLLQYILKGDDGKKFRDVLSLSTHYKNLFAATSGPVTITTTEQDSDGQVIHRKSSFDLRYQAILIISIMIKYDNNWLVSRKTLVENLKQTWCSDEFHLKHDRVDAADYAHWKEPKLLMKCLLNCFQIQTEDVTMDVIDLLFQLLRAFMYRYPSDFEFFRIFLEKTVIETYSIEWKRNAFAKFVNVFNDPNYPQKLKAKILQHIVIPCFAHSFQKGFGEALLGGPPQPERDNPNNLVHMFINKVIDPITNGDKKLVVSDAVRILLLQFSCLLVDQAAPHISEASNRRQSLRLKKLVSLAWPSLVNRSAVDPAAKYHGHYLLSHIIAKFSVHKRTIIQVLLSLLKASTPDARIVVKQALDTLLPAIPNRLEEGNSLLLKWTKKIIVEDGHTLNQLIHMLQLLVRHYRLYYPIRATLIPLLINAIQRLGYTGGPIENRRTAVDLCEVIMRWELLRQKEVRDKKQQQAQSQQSQVQAQLQPVDPQPQPQPPTPNQPQSQQALPNQLNQSNQISTQLPSTDPISEPIDQKHIDAILNALLRLACMINPDIPPSPAYTTCKGLSERCINLIKKILHPEAWGGAPNLHFAPWMGELLMTVQNPSCNVGSISGALELLTYLCGQVRPEAMLSNLKSLTEGIVACTKSHNSRIIRSVSNLVQRVMFVFPTPTVVSPTNNPPSAPHEELEPLYNSINRVIMSGLAIYEQTQIRPPDQQMTINRERDTSQVPLFSSLMLLKAACINNITYVDRVMPNLIRVIHKMTREHINHMVDTTPMSVELLILGLDLVKNRLNNMILELRKQFIQQILSNLIESPSSDVKVMKAVVRIVEEWMKQKQTQPTQGPNLREKTLLLIKLMLFIEKRFPHDAELNSQFLELIYFVYRDEELKTTDLTTKLESAFMSGLRCVQPSIRAKFFQIFDQSVKPKLYERLMYIVCAQNWQQIGCHFWIQQCIEFILAIALADLPISTIDSSGCLPCVPTSVDLGSYNPSEYESTSSLLTMLSNDANTVLTPPDDWDFVSDHKDIDNLSGFLRIPEVLSEQTPRKNLLIMVNRQAKFMDDLKKTRTGDLLQSITQLCHMSVELAKATWITMFPRIWKVLNDQQMTLLGREIIPFLCSGAHVFQRDCNPSAVGAFMEAVSRCTPAIQMRPILIKYLGKNHNTWHRAALMLEECLKDKSLDTCYPIPARSNKSLQQNQLDFDIITLNSKFTLAEEAVESISDILELLRENDLWCGLWQRKAQYEETRNAVLYEQQGLFYDAQECYEAAMDRQRKEFDTTHTIKPGMKSENRVWEKHWIRCTKELNQWDSLLDYGSSKACLNPGLVMESAWRVPNWPMMKEALCMVEENCPPSQLWRLHLFKGYNHICNQQSPNSLQMVDDCHHLATSYCIQTWKKLPHIITNAHIPLLQAAQQLLELNEAKSLHLSLCGLNRNGMHEFRTILKGWPKRVPILFDDLSYWSDILTWRQHQYQTIVAHFESQAANQQNQAMSHGGPVPMMNDGPASVAMQGTHFSAQGIISFGTVCRKQGALGLSLELLSRIHTIPRVPVFDCFQKIRQQIKCYLQMPVSPDQCELLDGIDVIECTNLQYFHKEYVAEFYTYKGIFLSRLGRHEEASKVFSSAAQMNDSIPKIWSAWGEFLESRFTADFTQSNEGFTIDSNKFANRQMDTGVSAITCYLQASKYYHETRARKYLAKVLWLLSFDNNKGELVDLLNKFTGPNREAAIPPLNWIVWIPQILQCMMLNPEPDALRNLLVTVGKHSPQAVYFPVRTLLFTLRVVFQHISSQQPTLVQQLSQPPISTKTMPSPGGPSSVASSFSSSTGANTPIYKGGSTSQPIASGPASPQSKSVKHRQKTIGRCLDIAKRITEAHPTTISSLEAISDQLVWLKDYSYEEVQRQIHQALTKCYTLAFDNAHNISEQTVSPQTVNFVRKLVGSFGVALSNNMHPSNPARCGGYTNTTLEYLAIRHQNIAADPEFQQTRLRFRSDFDDATLPNMKLITLIGKLQNWINILGQKKKSMPKTYLIEDKCRFLGNFSQHTADVEIPGDALMPKTGIYYVRIARFVPEVNVVEKHNTSARRILIRGHNGKIYPYLVLNDSCVSDSRREERVLQMLRLLNLYLLTRKETGRRFLQFNVPRVVAISPGLRLVEDNPSSLSLIDILKRRINMGRSTAAGNELDHDSPINEYYDRLVKFQAQGTPPTHRNMRDILTDIQNKMIGKNLLREWASQTYVDATEYWVFRSQFTYQLAMNCFAEYIFHLTRMMPESIYIHQDTGQINVAFFKFDLDDSNELRGNRPVPFRLTPNLAEFITQIGIAGPFRGAIEAVAHCLSSPQGRVVSIIRAILRDEMLFWQKRGQDMIDGEAIIQMVNKAVSKIYQRLANCSSEEQPLESQIGQLIIQAQNPDQLCQMDPAWHAWV